MARGLQLGVAHLQPAVATACQVSVILSAPSAPSPHPHTDRRRLTNNDDDRFHCGQTITLSTALGVATLFLTWRPALVAGTSREVARESLRVAAFTGSVYWLAGLAAILFPGSDGLDPEFGGPGFPQRPLFMGLAACGLAGSWLESR